MKFECPICDTTVGEDTKICPGCGAIFAGDEEEAKSPYDEIAIKLQK